MRRPDLHDLAQRIDAPTVTRFAPSPTGYLHIGHVVNAIYTWGVARAQPYQYAVTCDERQAVTLVIRGEDLLVSTGRQIRLARMLGRAAAAAGLIASPSPIAASDVAQMFRG